MTQYPVESHAHRHPNRSCSPAGKPLHVAHMYCSQAAQTSSGGSQNHSPSMQDSPGRGGGPPHLQLGHSGSGYDCTDSPMTSTVGQTHCPFRHSGSKNQSEGHWTMQSYAGSMPQPTSAPPLPPVPPIPPVPPTLPVPPVPPCPPDPAIPPPGSPELGEQAAWASSVISNTSALLMTTPSLDRPDVSGREGPRPACALPGKASAARLPGE